MTREEAIEMLDKWGVLLPSEASEAIDMAIEALSADRPIGEWIAKDGVFYCSCCDNDSAGLSEDDVYVYGISLPNYCGHCGVRMTKGGEKE